MSKTKTSSKSRPITVNDFPEKTIKEIIYWSRKLKISPSELFTISSEELEKRIFKEQRDATDEEQKKKILERLAARRKELMETAESKRLRGGAGRNIWDILCEAASQIEDIYGTPNNTYDATAEDSYDTTDSCRDRTYNVSRSRGESSYDSCVFPTDMTYTLSGDEPSFESTFEDSFQIDPNLASTPKGAGSAHRQLPVNNTYCVPCDNSFQVDPSLASTSNWTGSSHRQLPGNKTYNVPRRPANETYRVTRQRSPAANATYSTPQCPNSSYDRRYNYTSGNSFQWPASVTHDSTIDEGSWRPQTMTFADDTFQTAYSSSPASPSSPMSDTVPMSPPSFRNFTDYSMKFSPSGTEETANSITIESFDENSGVVNAASETTSTPAGAPLNQTYNITNGRLRSQSPSPCRATPPPPPAGVYNTASRPLPNRRYRPRRLYDECEFEAM